MKDGFSIRGEDGLAASAALAAVAVAATLALVKAWALHRTGSLGVAASLADSAIDALASLGGLVAILYASKPADEEHAFGHGAAEDLAALAQAALLSVSAGLIAWRAAGRLASEAPSPLADEGAGMIAMGVSVALTLALVLWQRRVAARTGSRVVAADSLHYLSDLLPNLGAIAALGASAWLGVQDLDSLVGLAAAGLLAFGAWRIAGGAWQALMDHRADAETLARLQQIASAHPDLVGFHDLKTRTNGRRLFVQIHVELPGDMPLLQAHDIGDDLRLRIQAEFPQAEVLVHKDPV